MSTTTVGGAVAVRQKQDQIVDWVRSQQDEIAMVAATHIKPSAIVRVAHGALRRNPKLMAAAIANPQSLLYALLDAARLGHEPDTDDYYLVPFGSEVQGIEGYKGIIERMYRAGGVSSVVAQVVRQRDRYAPRGENTPPFHEYDDFASASDRGALRGAYAYAIFPGGQCSQVIRMGRAEIMEHKARSRGSDKSDSPWQQWEAAMWKKTVLRALEPYVPTSTEHRREQLPASTAAVQAAPPPADTERTSVPPAAVDTEIADAEIVDEPAEPRPAVQESTSGQASMIARHFKRLGFTDDEREQRLAATAKLARTGPITSTKDLDHDQAGLVKAALEKCKDRGALVKLLATGEQDDDAEQVPGE